MSAWLELLPRHWAAFLEQHQLLHWPGLGVFRWDSEGYTLQLSSSFAEGLNKPFVMFVPVRLGPDYHPQGELEQRPLSSLESLSSRYSTLRYEARQPESVVEAPRHTKPILYRWRKPHRQRAYPQQRKSLAPPYQSRLSLTSVRRLTHWREKAHSLL